MSKEQAEIIKTFIALAESAQAIVEALAPTLVDFHTLCWSAYRDVAGLPYGYSEEGLQRWIRELGEAEQLKHKAEMILLHHETLARLREKVERA